MRYFRTFLKRWYLYIIPVLIVPVVTTALGYKSLMLYQSSALIYVEQPVFLNPSNANPYLSPADNETMSMSQLLGSETFVATIAAQTDLAKTLDLSSEAGRSAAFLQITGDMTVYATGRGPNTVIIAATDRNPHLAEQIVQASLTQFTAYFLTHRVELDQQGIVFYQQQLATAQSQYNQDSAKLTDYLNRHPGETTASSTVDPTLASLSQQVAQDQSGITTLQSQIDSLRTDTQAASAGTSLFLSVLDQPQLPQRPTLALKTLAMTYTLEGFGGAVGFDVLVIVLLTLLDRKVYFAEDLRKVGDELELEGIMIEKLPNLARLGSGIRPRLGADSSVSPALMPVIAALPQLRGRAVPDGAGQPVG